MGGAHQKAWRAVLWPTPVARLWNRLYDFGERHSPFSCYGRNKAYSAAKGVNVTNVNTQRSLANRHTYHNISYFFNCQNDDHLGHAMSFDYASSLLHLPLQKGRMRARDIILSFSVLPVLIHKSTLSPLRVQELCPIFSKSFCCCSHKCLFGKAGAASLIDMF